MSTAQPNHGTVAELTPSQIVAELDKYIVGQQNAKKSVAIALRNRWRRQQIGGLMREEIMPNNIIMIGPTGVGKTEIARRLARLANAPFLKVEATKFTEVGYVGRDVESMIRDLTEIGVAMVRAEHTSHLHERAEERVEERLLDLLQPRDHGFMMPFTIPGMMPQQPPQVDPEQQRQEREALRARLRAGQLETTEVEMDLTDDTHSSQMAATFASLAGDEMGRNLQELMGSMMPKRTVRRRITLSEARRHIANEEASNLIDNEAVIREALDRVQNSGIVFIDEIDKIAGVGTGGSGPDVSREGVQRDLLPVVEGTTVNTKYGPVKSDHVLFIASGAFHISKPSDLLPELQGRFPIRVELDSLTADDFVEILTLPENALVKQYRALMATESVDLVFTDDGIAEIAQVAAEVNEDVENIGARRLHTVLTSLLEDYLFAAPDNIPERTINITSDLVRRKLDTVVKNSELSRYVL
jgi:ATP-dependent HslUV protease ATP-binding subunit HslU